MEKNFTLDVKEIIAELNKLDKRIKAIEQQLSITVPTADKFSLVNTKYEEKP
jgi:tetrahydromethanopterin S-methyltransferase subunit B